MVATLVKFIEGKQILLPYFTVDSLEAKPKWTILERMIENTIEDIEVLQKLRILTGEDVGEPFTDEHKEAINQNLFKKIELDL